METVLSLIDYLHLTHEILSPLVSLCLHPPTSTLELILSSHPHTLPGVWIRTGKHDLHPTSMIHVSHKCTPVWLIYEHGELIMITFVITCLFPDLCLLRVSPATSAPTQLRWSTYRGPAVNQLTTECHLQPPEVACVGGSFVVCKKVLYWETGRYFVWRFDIFVPAATAKKFLSKTMSRNIFIPSIVTRQFW